MWLMMAMAHQPASNTWRHRRADHSHRDQRISAGRGRDLSPKSSSSSSASTSTCLIKVQVPQRHSTRLSQAPFRLVSATRGDT